MSQTRAQPSGSITVVASILLVTALGSIHAFSIFVPEWESRATVSRAHVSLIYSIALASLTVAVLVGYRIFRVFTAPTIFILVGAIAGCGLVLSGYFVSIKALYIFYGLLFGASNGLGYGYALQLSAQATPNQPGVSMCLVTAFYAVGATLSPLLFATLIQSGGNSLALFTAGGVVMATSIVSAGLVYWAKPEFKGENPSSLLRLPLHLRRARWLLWLGYGTSVASGLMLIGHAFNVAGWMGFSLRQATIATVIVALGNMLGGFSAVYFADRIAKRNLLMLLPVITTLCLIVLMSPLAGILTVGLLGLGIVGYCYGALIAVYPVAVSDLFGALSAPRVYGQIFTAWGIAGLTAPWLSGYLFDLTESYVTALVIAACCNVVAILAIHRGLPKKQGTY